MSTQNPSLKAFVACCGALGPVLAGIGRADEMPPPRTVSAARPAEAVLLLHSGRVLPPGQLSEDGSEYVLRQSGGTIRFPKREVEKIFGSVQAVYQYKRSQLAQNDPDEHMKLAKWCLSMKLDPEAKAELQAVLELNPAYGEAKAMIVSLDAAAERAGRSRFDPEIARAGGGEVARREGPGELNPEVLRPAPRGPQATALGLPVIFDLPPALAVNRAREFENWVHPRLQQHCASCHNEQFAGSFQLIKVRASRDYHDALIVRANLEATLRLVDPQNLSHSLLLTSTLTPHKPYNQPILGSPKSRVYQTLATWVNSLKPTPMASDGAPMPAGAGFGSDRGAQAPAVAQTAPAQSGRGKPGETVEGAIPLPPDQIPFEVAPPNAPANLEFPVPPAAGGPFVIPKETQLQPDRPASQPATGLPPAPSTQPIPQPGGATSPAREDATGTDATAGTSAKDDKSASATKKKKKPNLDPSVLEKFLQSRNPK
ncbi:MAG TPA: hypothetical protein VGY53_07855 [Isosphaeraceae bacterium]|nr:hypothetical protein [Isosphaeraceae bacterium]